MSFVILGIYTKLRENMKRAIYWGICSVKGEKKNIQMTSNKLDKTNETFIY